jgi:glycine hydroxymethyltransferase
VDNAKALAGELLALGFDLVSGGTDNHLILIDLTSKDVPGKVAAQALDRAGIETNYNTVPFDPRKPFDPSGMRIGTASVSTRGMGRDEMVAIARLMDRGVSAARDGDEAALAALGDDVRELTGAFPAPGIDS